MTNYRCPITAHSLSARDGGDSAAAGTVYCARDSDTIACGVKVVKDGAFGVTGPSASCEIRGRRTPASPHLPRFDAGPPTGSCSTYAYIEGESLRERRRGAPATVDDAVGGREKSLRAGFAFARCDHRDIRGHPADEGSAGRGFRHRPAVSAAGGIRFRKPESLGTPDYKPGAGTAIRELDGGATYTRSAACLEMLAGSRRIPAPARRRHRRITLRRRLRLPARAASTDSSPPSSGDERLPAERFQTVAQFAEAHHPRRADTGRSACRGSQVRQRPGFLRPRAWSARNRSRPGRAGWSRPPEKRRTLCHSHRRRSHMSTRPAAPRALTQALIYMARRRWVPQLLPGAWIRPRSPRYPGRDGYGRSSRRTYLLGFVVGERRRSQSPGHPITITTGVRFSRPRWTAATRSLRGLPAVTRSGRFPRRRGRERSPRSHRGRRKCPPSSDVSREKVVLVLRSGGPPGTGGDRLQSGDEDDRARGVTPPLIATAIWCMPDGLSRPCL